jgi:hypothetical protein
MTERPFLEKSKKPTEPTLQAALGSTYTHYKKVISVASSYSQDWAFTPKGGWMLKVSDRKKALLYLIPLNGGFKISLAIRETERDAFLRDGELGMLHDKIAASKKYLEGFALQFDISNKNEFQPVAVFIKKLITLRS